VLLEPQIAQHLAMMLHELATNSVKYGALKDSRGAVTISWAIAGQNLNLLWLERCAVRISGPIKRGFGSTLIEQSARGSGGDARMLMGSDGVSWHISIPLPRWGNKQGAVRQADTGPEWQDEPGEQVSSVALAGKRLLIVEDEPLVALDLAAKLTDEGIEVAGPVSSAEEALRIIEATSLDGALLDANLHGHPVDSIAEALAQRGVPLVFVTGYGRQSLPRAFASAALLPKPFSNDQLIEALIQLTARPAAVSAKAS
jgi:CheY-like chemotaxis protein